MLKRNGPKRFKSKEKKPKVYPNGGSVDDSSAVNLAHNYSATWDPILSAKLRTIKEMIAPIFVIFVIIIKLGLASTKHTHAHTYKEIIKNCMSMLNVLGNACRRVL